MKNASNTIPNQGNRRSDIFAAAVALFRRYGYDDTSMRDIANAVGVMRHPSTTTTHQRKRFSWRPP